MTKQFRNIHIYLSLFFLPLALMYALSGILYIAGINQDFGATKQTYTLVQNIEKGQEVQALVEYLKSTQLKVPSNLEAKMDRKSGALEIGGVHYSASIKQNADSTWSVTTMERSLIGDMIMLHKAKAKWYFDILAIGFGLTLILLYISGLMITLFNIKKNRGIQIFTILAGIIISVIVGALSVC
ncbi:PepSY domain-containing protein [Helicobacter ganmani]|uniref:PepSY domain-containing protein n=1 Tax=Helicobacter TaxID=209 RepID=UPI0026314830|nr:PepSY domain-containing protein [Helicobacter sp. UBA3407]